MARKRMVDPEFWLDEDITSLGFEYRLFYIGTWNFADDYGVIENSAKKLKAQIFPYDEVDCSKILKKLIDAKKLISFQSEGKEWLYIKRFLKYQRVDKPSKNRNPEAPKDIIGDDSANTQELVLDEVKLSKEKLREENIKEVYGEFEKVRLSLLEYQKLIEKLGEKNTLILIRELDEYLASKGKNKYVNHYAVIQTWARRKFQEHVDKNKPKRTIA